MNIFKIDLIPAGSFVSGTYNYTVKIQKTNSVWETVFHGKVFIQEEHDYVGIELEDIIWNYKWDGLNFFSPEVNTAGDNYEMCATMSNLQSFWYNKMRVEIPDLNVYTDKFVPFYSTGMFGTVCDTPTSNCVVFNLNQQPVCHVPQNAPEGFRFRQLVWGGTFTKDIDGNTTTEYRNGLGVIQFTGGQDYYGINGTTVAKIDRCAKPYYLCWLTNSGTMQCQGFGKATEFSVDYSNNQRVDMSGFKWNYNKSVTAHWNLKSGFLTDVEYKAYGEMFNSSYLILLDMENSKMHYVNVKDTTYKRKLNNVGKEKRIYFEVKVESAEIKRI